MNWCVVAASAIGTSHLISGDDCQDSCLAHVLVSPNRTPLLFIAVADGAGSAFCGGDGAELAIESSATFVAEKYALPEFALNDEFAIECAMAVRQRIYAEAEAKGNRARDYACTFICVLSSSQGTLVMQIGDGGIALDLGQGLQVPIVPMAGEYANMTNFITDEDALDTLKFETFLQMATRVAVFSDGVQRLALNMANNTAHEPFFEPFFKVLSTAAPEKEEQLRSALANFLTSESVNARTDDDKTLAFAVLVS